VDRVQAFIDAENEQRRAAQQERALRALSQVAPKSADEARMIEESAKKRDRDRGGGQTL
jgi:hypothetical protein